VTSPNDLADELVRDRAEFFSALDTVAPESMTTPGLVGEWSARELIAHLGYWVGHATETIHAVEQGRTMEAEPAVDEVNETVARIARATDFATVRRREAASVDALLERLRALDPPTLDAVLPAGDTLRDAIRDDGAEHYHEHFEALRTTLAEPPRG
jgi:hypothetical protein